MDRHLQSAFRRTLIKADDKMAVVRLGYVDPRELDGEWIDPYDKLLAELDYYREQVILHRDHSCAFDNNDYCSICGLDGRA